jgi:hypothetical protein
VRWLDAPLCEAGGNAPDFLDRPVNELWGIRVSLIRVFWGGGWFAL